ncbi:hypothetical protein [Bacillus mycoides]|nr:hypothetical protein [Bacillus mycoides]
MKLRPNVYGNYGQGEVLLFVRMKGEKNDLPSPGADFKYLIPDGIEEK